MFPAPGRRSGSPWEPQARRDSNPQPPVLETGALPIELRTYTSSPRRSSAAWLGTESNRRHHDFQSCALPTELPSPNKKPPGRLGSGGSFGRSFRRVYRLAPPAPVVGLDQESETSVVCARHAAVRRRRRARRKTLSDIASPVSSPGRRADPFQTRRSTAEAVLRNSGGRI